MGYCLINKGIVALTLSALLHGLPAGAQGTAGEGGLEYGITTELRYDDNLFRSESQEVDSLVLEANPFISGTLYNKGNTYQLGYRLSRAQYFDSSDDNYTDHEIKADLNHRFTDRHAIAVEAKYAQLTEQRGTGFSEEPNARVDGPDDYNSKNLSAIWFLGVPTADLRFELGLDRTEMEFDSSYVGDSRDYTADQLGILARYRMGARTDLLLEYRKLYVDYENTPLDFEGNPVSLDADEDYLLAGLAWEFTAKTRGEAKIGHSARDFDRNDFSTSDLHWEVNLEWRPRTYSTVALNTARSSLETYGSGLFINSQKYEAAWDHAWSGRLNTQLKLGVIEDDYETSRRMDDRAYWGIQVGYDYATWLKFRVGYEYMENDSTFRLVDYERNILFLNADIEL